MHCHDSIFLFTLCFLLECSFCMFCLSKSLAYAAHSTPKTHVSNLCPQFSITHSPFFPSVAHFEKQYPILASTTPWGIMPSFLWKQELNAFIPVLLAMFSVLAYTAFINVCWMELTELPWSRSEIMWTETKTMEMGRT